MYPMDDESEALNWTENPGCFERHLRRRFQNPLFPPDRRKVTRAELQSAQERDSEEFEEFSRQYAGLAERLDTLYELDCIPAQFLVNEQEVIGELIKKSAALGGDAFDQYPELEVLRERVKRSLRETVRNIPDLRDISEQIDILHEVRRSTTYHPLVAQMARPDTPIRGEDVDVRRCRPPFEDGPVNP